jgi:diguanylate cyclase (GGDEF)-like protein
MQRIRLLVCHASPVESRALQTELDAHADASRLELTRVGRLDEALARLDALACDAVLFGVGLGGPGDLATVAKLHEHAPNTAIVVVAGTPSPTFALDAVRHGAQDCLVRQRLATAPLARIVMFAVERQRRLTDIRAVALIDELTGLYNRRGFLALAHQQLRIAERLGSRLSQIFVDLDGLKRINDRFGHPAGDRALVETAQLLRETFRDSDIIARLGGDEFAVLTMDSAEHDAHTMLDRLAASVDAHNAWLNRDFAISLSTGVARYDGANPSSVGQLLAEADSWMYAQKRSKQLAAGAAADPARTTKSIGAA